MVAAQWLTVFGCHIATQAGLSALLELVASTGGGAGKQASWGGWGDQVSGRAVGDQGGKHASGGGFEYKCWGRSGIKQVASRLKADGCLLIVPR